MSYIDGMTAPGSSTGTSADRKPRDDEIDVFGLTHRGRVRTVNEDQFLIASLHKKVQVHMTSLPDSQAFSGDTSRLAFLAMVADGVGGGPHGDDASRWAIEALTQYVTHSLNCYYTSDATNQEAFTQGLEEAALHCHAELQLRADSDPELEGMATTLTLWLGVWPRAYVLQVGDSRAYLLRENRLTQLSSDQTMAQVLVEQGILTRADAMGTRWEHVLSSSIGGPESLPVVTRVDQQWGDVGLLCSDGLTKHVPDERIRERLKAMPTARAGCEALLQDALDDGGTDNITIVIGRTTKRVD
jgi:protein phosphatase